MNIGFLQQVEFVDRVFTKTGAGDDAEEAKARAAEAAKKKEMSKSKVSELWRLSLTISGFLFYLEVTHLFCVAQGQPHLLCRSKVVLKEIPLSNIS